MGQKIAFSFQFELPFLGSSKQYDNISPQTPKIVSTQKIWNEAQHSAFTDLIRFQDKWYCVFRESDEHAGGSNGVIRLIESTDGEIWRSVTVFAEQGIDLRDPKLSITPENQLMLLLGGSVYSEEGNYISKQPKVAFSLDGSNWTEFTKILEPHEWLWRVTWHNNKAYGISYRSSNLNNSSNDWIATLFVSDDGVHFQKIIQLNVFGHPSEATLRFLETGEMIALIRRGSYPNGRAWIGISEAPFENWAWNEAKFNLGGPNFLILPDHSMWASGRVIEKNACGEIIEKTILAKMNLNGINNVINLPSGGDDTSYPGMVYYDGMLWISYYSSHEDGKTAIYLAKVKVSK